MLKKRFIAVLIILDGKVVQSVNFRHTNVIHYDPIHAIEALNKWSVDEIVLLNVSKEESSQNNFLNDLKRISENCFVPVSAGGWITNHDYAKNLLRSGADKLVVNSSFYSNPIFTMELSAIHGKQCIVGSMDIKKNENGEPTVWTDRGRLDTKINPIEWAKHLVKHGAGEIFFNSIDHDGARKGYDHQTIKKISSNVTIPVIAFGGIFRWPQLIEGYNAGADGLAVANQLHYTEHAARKAKSFLYGSGIPIRKVS